MSFLSSLFLITVVRRDRQAEIIFDREIVLDETYLDAYEDLTQPDSQALIVQAQEAVISF